MKAAVFSSPLFAGLLFGGLVVGNLVAPKPVFAATPTPAVDAAPAAATRCVKDASVGRRKLLGGLMRGLGNAAPLIGAHGSGGLQAVMSVAGTTLASGADASSGQAVPCSAASE